MRLICIVFILSIITSCNNRDSNTQQKVESRDIHFSSSLTMNPDIIKYINDFVVEGNTLDTNRIYKLFIGNSFPYGSRYLLLTEIKYKQEWDDLPIAFIKIEDTPVLIYSDISKFCKKDSSVLKEAGIFNRINLIRDTLGSGYKEWLNQKRNWYIKEENNIFELGKAMRLPPQPSQDTFTNFSTPETIKKKNKETRGLH